MDISWNGYTKPPTCIGAVSFTTSTSVWRSIARWMARRTFGSASALFFCMFVQNAWMTDWLKTPAVMPCVSLTLRQLTGSSSRA